MADLTIDPVSCPRCGRSLDRSSYVQCPDDGEDLWGSVARAAATARPPNAVPHTILDAGRSAVVIRIAISGSEFVIDTGSALGLGRDEQYPTAAAFAAHGNVSRYHAVLRFDGTDLFVTDTRSTNGTFVDGTRLAVGAEYELRPGQALRLAADVEVDVRWQR
ncbi:FHA domain-containing protein [Nocardia sp. BMG111209]|uniref:FHA domain-containing protein n=1 Tax=Nocardia sp. BMG111209 TaxID=1160137 RepID=UPI0003697B55|nr:FHA domain-containing protein [Nocardia sp. BMG111209]